MTTRRSFLQYAATGLGAAAITTSLPVRAANAAPPIEQMKAICARLSKGGWRDMLKAVTGGALDIAAPDLKAELLKPLEKIERGFAGFGDFSIAGRRAIEPGRPDASLLYHAMAAPSVVVGVGGKELTVFPTLAELDTVENFIFSTVNASIASLRERFHGKTLGLAVFAVHYRNAPDSVHGTHAELCFARAGIARLGTQEALYDAKQRNFTPLHAAKPFDFRVMPQRYVPYIAVKLHGGESNIGPQDKLHGDEKLAFWAPVHKLFSGRECLQGLDLNVRLDRGLRNDELAMFRRFLDLNGLKNDIHGDALEDYPFVIKDEHIGSLTRALEFGPGVLVPRAQKITEVAVFKGKPLTVPVDGRYTSRPANIALSSLQVLPSAPAVVPRYMDDASQDTQRPGPEYVNIRHRLKPNGQIDNLNHDPNLKAELRKGGYDTLQYIDGAGDGWVEVHCPQLDKDIGIRMPAYAMVGLPDFFPKVKQRDLMQWWNSQVPEPIRAALWTVPPLALSQTRIAANITLPIGFSLTDNTIAAIVTIPGADSGPPQKPNGPTSVGKTGLPDGSPGLFDPGWDSSQGIYFTDESHPLQKFLAGYGLGSPFIEDAKLCAALGAYWPGVAPDATRTFAPDKQISGIPYPYPTIVPLTDEEIGIVPSPKYGKPMPWDGVPGPTAVEVGGTRYAQYRDAWRVDYIDTIGTMTAALTAEIDTAEYFARIMAMEAVYWGLGIHDPDFKPDDSGPKDRRQTAPQKVVAAKAKWAVLSFTKSGLKDPALVAAYRQAGVEPKSDRCYRFHMYLWEGEEAPVPGNMYDVRIKMTQETMAYASGTTVILQPPGKPWVGADPLPT